ncbi:MAG TPA: haloalkane dehalogenase [Myxococcota bacterium]|nr:haloalkane dehalogenase [Myxococcota bacterium]
MKETARVYRTPEARFADLPGYSFESRTVEIGDERLGPLRVHFVDEGERDAPVVLMLHGEPTWSYLYRKMIPVFVAAGFRAIAPDLVGFGRSDKPVEQSDYSFEGHVRWMRSLVSKLDLRDVTLFGQDWGGPIGLAVLAAEPERFHRAVAANTMLHTVEANLAGRTTWANHSVGDGEVRVSEMLLAWLVQAQRDTDFRASAAIEGATVRPIAPEVVAAYDAPFPEERAKKGMRQFPALIPMTTFDAGAAINRATWSVLERFERPFLTLFGDGDPATAGWETIFQERIPGAQGQRHETLEGAGHFLQEDRGEDVAERVVRFMRDTG